MSVYYLKHLRCPVSRPAEGPPMAVWDLFSKREKRKQKQGQEDVFQYDTLPEPFRVQVVHICLETLGGWQEPRFSGIDPQPNLWWTHLWRIITREKGVFALTPRGVTGHDRQP